MCQHIDNCTETDARVRVSAKLICQPMISTVVKQRKENKNVLYKMWNTKFG